MQRRGVLGQSWAPSRSPVTGDGITKSGDPGDAGRLSPTLMREYTRAARAVPSCLARFQTSSVHRLV